MTGPDPLVADEPDCLTVAEAAELLGITPDAARRQLSRWGIAGEVHYSATALREAVAKRRGRGNWTPPSANADLYQLKRDNLGHWWTCADCHKERGPYTTKRAARDAAERHHDDAKCTREYL